MIKAHNYKTKLNYKNSTKKTNTLKMELNISSNHEISEHLLNDINDAFKKIMVFDYVVDDSDKQDKKK